MKAIEYAIASRYMIDDSFGGRKITEITLSPDVGGVKPPIFISRMILSMQMEGNTPIIL